MAPLPSACLCLFGIAIKERSFRLSIKPPPPNERLEQLELSLQNRLAPVFERYSNALNQVKEYRENILPAAQESLDLSRQLYQAGEAGLSSICSQPSERIRKPIWPTSMLCEICALQRQKLKASYFPTAYKQEARELCSDSLTNSLPIGSGP